MTGAVSGLVIVDLDGEEGLKHLEGLPETAMVKTGRGLHGYFAHPGSTIRNSVRLAPGLDVRADGGLVVAPPSLHANGARYTWQYEGPVAPLPSWAQERVGQAALPSANALREEQQQGATQPPYTIPEGQRNDTLWRLGRKLRFKGWSAESIAKKLRKVNAEQCRPPMETWEVESIVRSVLDTPDEPRYQRHHNHQEKEPSS